MVCFRTADLARSKCTTIGSGLDSAGMVCHIKSNLARLVPQAKDQGRGYGGKVARPDFGLQFFIMQCKPVSGQIMTFRSGAAGYQGAEPLQKSGYRDSNAGPPAPKAGALANCATPRLGAKVVIIRETAKGGKTVKFDSICIKHNYKTGFFNLRVVFTKREA